MREEGKVIANVTVKVEPGAQYRLIAESETDIIGPQRRMALRDTYPSARIHTYRNAGHASLFTCFKEYVSTVRTFVQRHANKS